MHVLFLTRLLVYAIAVAMPLVHPAVTVPFDRAGYLVWFALVPIEMLLAYALRHAVSGTRWGGVPGGGAGGGASRVAKLGRRLAAAAHRWLTPYRLLAAALAAIVAAVGFGTGLDSGAWLVVAAGGGAFLLTLLIFGSREYGHTVAAVELFFIGYVYVKMLRFSRASEAISGATGPLTTAILILSIAGFLVHGIVIYLAAFPNRVPGLRGGEERGRGRRELALLTGVIPLLVLLALVLPPDFVEHRIAFNQLNELPPSPPVPVNDVSSGPPGGNLRGNEPLEPRERPGSGQGDGREQQQGEDQQGQQGQGDQGQRGEQPMPGLEGIPAREWDRRTAPQPSPEQGDANDGSGGSATEQGPAGGGSGSSSNPNQGPQQNEGDQGDQSGDGEGENKQYAVMVVASTHDPVYAADAYFGLFDAVEGFSYSADEPLNDLAYRRLFETWDNPESHGDRGRSPIELAFFSTIPERVLPYWPLAVEPTVQQRRYHPFDLSYRVVSEISLGDKHVWRNLRPLTARERERMSSYLEVPLEAEQRARFQSYLDQFVGAEENYYDKIELILQSYATCQYEIGFTDDVSIAHVDNFLFETRSGDCTEFSNTSAILGRMLGIPSRVVTGYLGSDSLQTAQHQRGAGILRQAIEPLQAYPVEDLYLITSAHRHSWTQFWLPDYGWVDFETTSYAKPPPPAADANMLDIVIPIIEVEDVPVPRTFQFPWRFALTVLATLAGLGVVGAYGLRYGREGWLTLRARRPDSGGLRALGNLLYMRMASTGCELKARAHTAQEYAERYPEIGRFAELYTMLRYRAAYDPGERSRTWQELRTQYQTALRGVRKGGLLPLLRRTFSLRALYY